MASKPKLDLGLPRGISIWQLVKHLFVSGMPGSGKSIFVISILLQLFKHGIPFIVFEPAKIGYRAIKCLKNDTNSAIRELAEALQIWRPGDAQFALNLLLREEGTRINEQIERVMSCCRAAMAMSEPAPAILAEALEEVYRDLPKIAAPPVMKDVLPAVRRVLTRKHYAPEVESNVRAILDVRLGIATRRTLGSVLGCRQDIPDLSQLMNSSSIIELPPVQEQACLVMMSILTRIHEYILTKPRVGPLPRLVIVIEEAHTLVGRDTNAEPSEENANPKAFAARFVADMLAEWRSLGVGVIVVDQHPSAVAEEVTRSTATKVAFKQVDQKDRESLGAAMLFSAFETEEIARLEPREAFLFTEKYPRPVLIRVPHLLVPEAPLGDAILPFISDEKWFVEGVRARQAADLDQLRRDMDRLDAQLARASRCAASLRGEEARLLPGRPGSQATELARLAREATRVRDGIKANLEAFVRDEHQPLLGGALSAEIKDRNLRASRDQLAKRWEEGTKPGLDACIGVLGDVIRRCTRPISQS